MTNITGWFEIGLIVGAFISGILITWFPRLRKKKKEKDPTGREFEAKHTQIHEELTKLRLVCDCARTYFVQFHNGGEFLDGNSMTKWSITHESVHLGIRNSLESGVFGGGTFSHQQNFATQYPDMIQMLHDDNSKICLTALMNEYSPLKAYMVGRNVSGFVISAIKDPKNLFVYGFVCCEWSSLNKLDQIDKDKEYEIYLQIKETTQIIEGLILTGHRKKRR